MILFELTNGLSINIDQIQFIEPASDVSDFDDGRPVGTFVQMIGNRFFSDDRSIEDFIKQLVNTEMAYHAHRARVESING